MIKKSKYLLYVLVYLIIQYVLGVLFIVLLGFNKGFRLLEYDWKVIFANVIIIIFLTLAFKKHILQYLNELKFSVKKIALYLFIGLIFSTISKFIFIEIYGGDFLFNPPSSLLLSNVLSVVLIAPIAEEIIYRAVPIEYLLKKELPKNWIVFFTSLFFSLIHLPNWSQIIVTFFLGVICSIVYIKERNLFYPIIIHFIYNLISVIIG
ncbi:type II CAAX endopeptidase family protein [Chryseobacterium tructae]|uniref:Type II CAAX endopeptidase family protein n=1 Tax=Chryseobacterium tructae TaxID=1037380 RepID=A0ABV7Y1Q2_9FLAO